MSIAGRFEAVAREYADELAIVDGVARVTYAELSESVDRIARQLADNHVEPGARVGVCGDRSMALIASVLAVMKAGASYVPLDPHYPARRLQFMVADAGLRTVIATDDTCAGRLSAETIVRPAPADSRSPVAARPAIDVRPGDCAYVMYTSGSTGAPKGVMVAHRNVTAFVDAMTELFALGPGDVVPALTSPSFDISGLEMLLPLVNGAAVAIVNRETASDGRRLRQFLTASGATLVQATPATWRLLLEAGWAGDRRQTLLCGGEPLPPNLARDLIPRCCALWNMYGPTETTIWSSAHRITSIAPRESVPIGPAIRGTKLYVLDEQFRPVPPGAAGELFIGGAGVAIGYLNRPEQTNQRFLPDPFSAVPGARMYRSGDRVRARSDGAFDYIGRVDHQVKVHGFRVEPGEIEAALSAHADVGQAVVVVDDDARRGRRLVAYVTSPRSDGQFAGDLREHLRARLPAHMIPAGIHRLAAFPMTRNGKIDRVAVQAMRHETDAASSPAPHTQVSDAVATRLTECWVRVLETAVPDECSNFFDLGGDSLDAARLFCEIEAAFGCDLPAATLIEAPTLGQLADVIRGRRQAVAARPENAAVLRDTTSVAREERWPTLVPIQPAGAALPVFVIHGGSGTVLFGASLATWLDSDRPVFGLQLEGLDGRGTVRRTVEQLAMAYIAEIRRLRPSGPYHLAGFCFGGLVAYEMARQLHRSGADVGLVALLNTPYPQFSAETTRPPDGRLSPMARCRDAVRWRWDVVRAGVRTVPHWFGVAAAHAYARAGLQIPARWRADYLYELTEGAANTYRPALYDGALTAIVGRGLGPSLSTAWRHAARQVDVIEVGPTQRLRRDLVREPIVRQLAVTLDERLAAAEAAPGGGRFRRQIIWNPRSSSTQPILTPNS